MPDTVKLPYVGPVRRNALYVAAAAILGYVGYAWWRSRSDSIGEGEAVATQPADEFGDDFSSEAGGPTSGPATSGSGGGFQLVAPDGEIPPSSNAEWTARAISALGDIGYEPSAVASAIGKYLARKGLTQAEAELINVARARLGPPPIGDFPVTMVEPTPTPPVVTPPVTKPRVTPPKAPTGVRVVSATRNTITLRWNGVSGATMYQTHMDGRAGYVRRSGATITIVSLRPGRRYVFRVRAVNSAGVGPVAPPVVGVTRT